MVHLPPVGAPADQLLGLRPLIRWHARRAMRRLPMMEVDDIFQSLMVRCVEALASYDPSRPLAPYLGAVMRRYVNNLMHEQMTRTRQHRYHRKELSQRHLAVPPRNRNLDLLSWLEKLNDMDRRLLELYYVHGLTCAEMAEKCGYANAASAQARVAQTLKKLRKWAKS